MMDSINYFFLPFNQLNLNIPQLSPLTGWVNIKVFGYTIEVGYCLFNLIANLPLN